MLSRSSIVSVFYTESSLTLVRNTGMLGWECPRASPHSEGSEFGLDKAEIPREVHIH